MRLVCILNAGNINVLRSARVPGATAKSFAVIQVLISILTSFKMTTGELGQHLNASRAARQHLCRCDTLNNVRPMV